MSFDFNEMLQFSMGQQQESDLLTIKSMIPGCVSVEPSTTEMNKTGVDYIATLRRGAQILIDAKTRTPGCSHFWVNQEPEVALESWSVLPAGKYGTPKDRSQRGWTLCEHKNVDLILFKFCPKDSTKTYLVCFQLLRIAFKNHFRDWMSVYKVMVQDSNSWESQCVFVPISVVFKAIQDASTGTIITP